MLRAEYHYINGTGWVSPLDNRAPSEIRSALGRPFLTADTDQHWNLLHSKLRIVSKCRHNEVQSFSITHAS